WPDRLRSTSRSARRSSAGRRRPGIGAHPPLDEARDRLEEPGEFGRDDELRGRAVAEGLERLEVLERHRLLVDRGRRPIDPGERLTEALGPEDRRLPLALGLEDLRLLLAFGDVDRSLTGALRFGDDRAPGAL